MRIPSQALAATLVAASATLAAPAAAEYPEKNVTFVVPFAAGSAYADLYRLKKAEKLLSQRLVAESSAQFGAPKTAKEVLATKGGAAGGGLSPLPKASAYDLMLEISNKVPAKDKITIDITQLQIDDQKIDIEGTAKTAENLDLLVTELKKIQCFKSVMPGQTDTNADGSKEFKLSITSAGCM